MLSKLAGQKISDALRIGALVGLLAVVAGCNTTSGGQPTNVPTGTAPPIAAPTIMPTEVAATAEVASPTIPAAETPTELASSPTTPPDPTPVVINTPAPTMSVGDLQWKQVGLGGNNVTDLSFISQGSNVVVLAAGPKGVWTGTYDYSQWDKHDVAMAEEARNAEADVASDQVMYVTSHTGCPSGLPSARSRSTDGGKSWQEMSGEAMTIAVANATTAYGAKCSGLNKTTDSGATWADLSVTTQSSDPISLAASPDGQMVYAAYISEGGTGQIMMSKDGGATWSDVTPRNVPQEGFLAPGHLTFLPGSEGRPDEGGLYLTNNEGVWFLPLDSGDWKLMTKSNLPTSPEGTFSNFTALFVDAAYSAEYDKPGAILYTARAESTIDKLLGQGVYRSADMGTTWQSVGTGLEQHVVNSLALIPYDSSSGRVETLLAATDDGIWALTLPPSSR
ncbi:MAG TPA: sialidase family protein [Chloroflexia bacterium]|nr:sialidase family protein [Chloroflexia bacterium]